MQRDVKSKRGKEREVEVEVREGDEIRRSKEGGRQTPNASYRATRFLTAAGFSSSTRSSQTQLTYRNVSVRSINPCTSLTGKQVSGIEMTSSAWHRWIQKWQGCGLCILQVSQKPGWSTLRELGWEYWPRRPEVHKNARGFWSVQNLRYLLSLLHLPAQLTLHPSHLFHTLYYIDCREM